MDTVKEEERGSERGREREGQMVDKGRAWQHWQLMERKNAGDNANEQHNMQLEWDETSQAKRERGGKCRNCAWAQLALIAQCTPPHTHTLYTSPPRCPPHIYCIVALVRIVPVRITPMERLCSVQRN